jgi:hypothetical protein
MHGASVVPKFSDFCRIHHTPEPGTLVSMQGSADELISAQLIDNELLNQFKQAKNSTRKTST